MAAVLSGETSMTAANYAILSACIFALVAVLQLVRALKGWPVTIASTSIPIWVSWIACVVAAILVWLGIAVSQT